MRKPCTRVSYVHATMCLHELLTRPRETELWLPRTARARSLSMPLHESKADATRRRREATRKFLNDQAYEVRRLRNQNAGHEMMNPTIDYLDAVLAARHATEFRYESFAYLSGRSPQAERWHKEKTQWAQDMVDARRRRLRATSNWRVRSAERAAEAVAARGQREARREAERRPPGALPSRPGKAQETRAAGYSGQGARMAESSGPSCHREDQCPGNVGQGMAECPQKAATRACQLRSGSSAHGHCSARSGCRGARSRSRASRPLRARTDGV